MRCAVTGASGFIGRNLVRGLVNDGHEVTALDLVNKGLPDGVEFRAADVTTSKDLKKIFGGTDVVFHLAGRLSTATPQLIKLTNIEGTRRVAEAAASAGAKGLVYASSIAVYGDTGGRAVAEDAPLHPTTHYGMSKVTAESILRAAVGTGLPVTVLRPGFVYGPQCPILQGFVEKRPYVVGPSNHLGCYLHVADLVEGLRLSANRLDGFQVYNIVDDEPLPAKEFVRLVAEASGTGPPGRASLLAVRIALPILERFTASTGGAFRLTTDFLKIYLTNIRVDTRRIQETFGWRPRFPSSRQGLNGCF